MHMHCVLSNDASISLMKCIMMPDHQIQHVIHNKNMDTEIQDNLLHRVDAHASVSTCSGLSCTKPSAHNVCSSFHLIHILYIQVQAFKELLKHGSVEPSASLATKSMEKYPERATDLPDDLFQLVYKDGAPVPKHIYRYETLGLHIPLRKTSRLLNEPKVHGASVDLQQQVSPWNPWQAADSSGFQHFAPSSGFQHFAPWNSWQAGYWPSASNTWDW